MARRVVKEVHHTSGGGGGFGVLGVIIGALLVVGAIFFFAGGSDMFASRGGSSGPSVTVNTAPSGANPGHSPDHAKCSGDDWLRSGALSFRGELMPGGRAKALPFRFGAILSLP